MKKLLFILFLLPGLLFAGNKQIFDKDGIPKKPTPERLVNIIEGSPAMFSAQEVKALESNLVDFSKKTGVQIALVVVPSLNGYEKAQMATEIGHRWGVGEKGKDNGLVVLIKPKTASSRGQIFIASGYGLEGVIPDAVAKRIVESEILPSFQNKNYYEGITKSLATMQSLALKEFPPSEYLDRTDTSSGLAGILPFLLFIFFFYALLRRNKKRHYSTHSVPFWTALWLGGSMSRGSSSGWSDFSSGSGGFGGFGGGDFGGGGAGGSW